MVSKSSTLWAWLLLAAACGAPVQPPPALSHSGEPAPPTRFAILSAPATEAAADARAALSEEPPAAPPGAVVRFEVVGRGRQLAMRASPTAQNLFASALVAEFAQREPSWMPLLTPSSDRGGIDEVRARRADAAIALTPLSTRDRDQGLRAHQLGYLVAALAVAPQNATRTLTRTQVRDVLNGRAEQWNQLSLQRGPIALLLEPDGLVQRQLQSMLIAGDRFTDRAETAASAQALRTRVADNPGCVGAVFATTAFDPSQIRLMAVDGVSPDLGNAAIGRYPFSVEVSLVTDGHTPPGAQALLDFVRSEAGKAVLRRRLLLP